MFVGWLDFQVHLDLLLLLFLDFIRNNLVLANRIIILDIIFARGVELEVTQHSSPAILAVVVEVIVRSWAQSSIIKVLRNVQHF